MKLSIFLCVSAVFLVFGCSASVQQEPVTTQPPALQAPVDKDLELIDSQGNDYFVWKYDGRIYVIGNPKTNEAFKIQHHLPYTRTILGAGPQGETVIFEVNPKDNALADRLQVRYDSTPVLLTSEGNDYFVWKYQGRIYVIGQEKTNEAFKTQHHLPYTRTVLGAGPYDETVIFEVNPKDDALANRLQAKFEQG
jgi:hypothetical protein